MGGDSPRSLLGGDGGGGGVCQQDPHLTPERFQGGFLSTGPNPNPPLLRCILQVGKLSHGTILAVPSMPQLLALVV